MWTEQRFLRALADRLAEVFSRQRPHLKFSFSLEIRCFESMCKSKNHRAFRGRKQKRGEGVEKETLQWHPVFCAAMEVELEGVEGIRFHREYNLTRKPLQVDIVIVDEEKEE